ncbi:peptidylprolyl isomerase [Amnibacterium sp. CER49]|uniref:peptidylprolyl isomerase n=1 Tax=Amnibacterium sp. CER49 TaxID=3039161 RepID=UPI00244B5D33|nr:peptidylprolyl isomerase [Amnibacterium sp. CER49]MDH2444317.1 peptidylprolyl isomerase [Amnibacterium sp. CER49]
MPARNPRDRADREARRRAREYAAKQAVHAQRRKRRRRDELIGLIAFLVVLALATAAQITYATVGPGKPVAKPTTSATAAPTPTPTPTATVPPKALSENRTWTGSITLDSVRLGFTLDGKAAPQAVANFVSLVKKGFYTGLTCHRLTTGSSHVLQCGDPKGDGTGGPGYSFGPIENAPKNQIYPTGDLAMARVGGNADSQGSQFFLVYSTSGFPNDAAGGYTVFGHVTSGLPGLRSAITSKGTDNGTNDGKPKVPTKITAVTVK